MIDLLSFRLGLLLPKMPFFQISEQSFLRMASDSDVSSVSDLAQFHEKVTMGPLCRSLLNLGMSQSAVNF